MLGKGSTDTGGVLGPQCDTATAFVLKVIHLFCDHIRGVTET